jgi:hypothetical protein
MPARSPSACDPRLCKAVLRKAFYPRTFVRFPASAGPFVCYTLHPFVSHHRKLLPSSALSRKTRPPNLMKRTGSSNFTHRRLPEPNRFVATPCSIASLIEAFRLLIDPAMRLVECQLNEWDVVALESGGFVPHSASAKQANGGYRVRRCSSIHLAPDPDANGTSAKFVNW